MVITNERQAKMFTLLVWLAEWLMLVVGGWFLFGLVSLVIAWFFVDVDVNSEN